MFLSPLDGRYRSKVEDLGVIFSEFGLFRARTQVEVEWLIFLGEQGLAPEMEAKSQTTLRGVYENFSDSDFDRIKEIESTTNHDVKAVELFLREKTDSAYWPWIHFACTSEDINNLSYALMVREGREVLLRDLEIVLSDLQTKSMEWKSIPMLCRTHGQTATPSTLGKEMAVFLSRGNKIVESLKKVPVSGKINGATGTFSAHKVAFPQTDWMALSEEFVGGVLKLDHQLLTTQIEPHDDQAFMLNELGRCSNVFIDLCRDIWGYISLGYFGQKVVQGEVGSSTMPHKVNPIDFENAEGNLKLARGIGRTLADELPISRWQRDLTDSTLQRNLGLAFGHFLLGLKSLQKGLGKLEVREEALLKDLQAAPEVLTEAVQTVLRAHGEAEAYDLLKAFSRGKALTLDGVRDFIDSTQLPDEVKSELKTLTPERYVGVAEALVEKYVKQ